MSEFPEYLLVEIERLVARAMVHEATLKSDLLPFAAKAVREELSNIRKHINGMAQVARRAGATGDQISAIVNGLKAKEKEEKLPNCFVCGTTMAEDHNFLDMDGNAFLYCPKCSPPDKEENDD